MKKRTQVLLKLVRERFFSSKQKTGKRLDHHLSNLYSMNKSTLLSKAPEFEL